MYLPTCMLTKSTSDTPVPSATLSTRRWKCICRRACRQRVASGPAQWAHTITYSTLSLKYWSFELTVSYKKCQKTFVHFQFFTSVFFSTFPKVFVWIALALLSGFKTSSCLCVCDKFWKNPYWSGSFFYRTSNASMGAACCSWSFWCGAQGSEFRAGRIMYYISMDIYGRSMSGQSCDRNLFWH